MVKRPRPHTKQSVDEGRSVTRKHVSYSANHYMCLNSMFHLLLVSVSIYKNSNVQVHSAIEDYPDVIYGAFDIKRILYGADSTAG